MLVYRKLSEFVYDCSNCPTRCDGLSRGFYNFENDASFSEDFEEEIINKINLHTAYSAKKSSNHSFPDIEVTHPEKEKFYIEIKVQRRAFMQVERYLPHAGIKPSQTLALNKSDLLRYFDIAANHNCKIFIMWVLLERPCLTGNQTPRYFYQSERKLKEIFQANLDKRTFRRKSGDGDIVEGKHKGVVVNYHFSIDELTESVQLFGKKPD